MNVYTCHGYGYIRDHGGLGFSGQKYHQLIIPSWDLAVLLHLKEIYAMEISTD